MKIILLFLCLSIPSALLAQNSLVASQQALVGTRIDSLAMTGFLLNEPAEKDFSRKFKVIEFWATWCRPCLAAVPHLNKLQEKFRDSNIVFLSVTDEKPKQTEETFRKVKFETIVASDTTRRTHRALRIDHNGTMVLPRTVLVDNENRIIWYGSPLKLTEKLIRRFLAGELTAE
ncbi:MAG TPA: TlpA disulfide reductase family protein [Flavisolibacter sp.]|nr:TlpA disulfide reductase family protein [Flavisolibacter sp.]